MGMGLKISGVENGNGTRYTRMVGSGNQTPITAHLYMELRQAATPTQGPLSVTRRRDPRQSQATY